MLGLGLKINKSTNIKSRFAKSAIGTSYVNGVSETLLTINKVTGVQDDDVMIATAYINNDAYTITPPAGWTFIGQQLDEGSFSAKVAFYYKIASNEPATYDWTFSTGTRVAVANVAFRNVDTLDVVNAFNIGQSADPITVPAITTDENNCAVVLIVVKDSGSNTVHSIPESMTELLNSNSLAGTMIAWQLQKTAGTTGTKATSSTPSDFSSAYMLIALNLQ